MILLVLPAAAAGGLIRWQLAERFNVGRTIPMGTFVANCAASFLIGLLSGLENGSELVVRVGLLGALSTWSTLANEVVELHRQAGRGWAALYLTSSVTSGVGLAWLGLQLAGN